jgi:hypothetical protein
MRFKRTRFGNNLSQIGLKSRARCKNACRKREISLFFQNFAKRGLRCAAISQRHQILQSGARALRNRTKYGCNVDSLDGNPMAASPILQQFFRQMDPKLANIENVFYLLQEARTVPTPLALVLLSLIVAA